MTELAPDDSERMLHIGTHHGDDPVNLLVYAIELAVLWGLAHHATDLAILAESSLASALT